MGGIGWDVSIRWLDGLIGWVTTSWFRKGYLGVHTLFKVPIPIRLIARVVLGGRGGVKVTYPACMTPDMEHSGVGMKSVD